jgi:hypothetical protein
MDQARVIIDYSLNVVFNINLFVVAVDAFSEYSIEHLSH